MHIHNKRRVETMFPLEQKNQTEAKKTHLLKYPFHSIHPLLYHGAAIFFYIPIRFFCNQSQPAFAVVARGKW